MRAVIGLVAALVAAAPSLRADFPSAQVTESPGGRVTQITGFAYSRPGASPEATARAFLRKYAAAFGLFRRETLVAKRTLPAGTPGAVAFERRIDGLPVFGGDVVVGVDAAGTVIAVNATDLPPRTRGRFELSRADAIEAARAALPGVEARGAPVTARGWYGQRDAIRPVWRVDLTAVKPPGDWRVYVDAETGTALFRMDRRVSAAPEGFAPRR